MFNFAGMNIKSAEFKCSNTKVDKLPPPVLPEYAFIGRSNVGKSSLINCLTQRKGLAKTSQTPGKTQLINHFLINENWYIVDLPGYGFAKTSRNNRGEWGKFIRAYILKRENLQCVFVLIDSRLEPQKIDLAFLDQLGKWEVPFTLVFTKADKETQKTVSKNVKSFLDAMRKTWQFLPPHVVTSAVKKMGRDKLLDFIEQTAG